MKPRLAGVAVVAALAPGCTEPDPSDNAGAAGRRNPSGPVTLAVAGDAMLARGIQHMFAGNPEYPLFRGLADPLDGVDVLGFNLETTITDHTAEWPDKKYHFKVDPKLADTVLASISADTGVSGLVASNANNHGLDYEIPGLLDTLAHLDAFGLPHIGAGSSATSARAPRIVSTDTGVRVALFAASSVCSCGNPTLWNAGPDTPGEWMLYDDASWQEAFDAVSAADVDWVVFTVHWGSNYHDSWPDETLRQRGEQLVAAGADLVFGTSAHEVLPTERFGNGLVLYGMGDFVDDYSPVPPHRNDLSYVGRVELTPGAEPRLTVIPIRIEHGNAHHVQVLAPSDPDHAIVLDAAKGA